MVTAIMLVCAMVAGTFLYTIWAAAAWYRGTAPWLLIAGGPLLYLAIFAFFTATWFALSCRHRSPRPPEARLSISKVARLFRNEWLALAGSALRMGFGWWLMREPRAAIGDAPVLLVHGVLCNAGVWIGMRGALRRRGVGPVHAISYGPPLASIEHFADQLNTRIEAIFAGGSAPRVTLIAHSMGGLVARAYLRHYGNHRVAGLITIATPHAGSVLARHFPGKSLLQMRRGNPWLQSLNAGAAPDIPIISIWSWHDSMVAPQDSAWLAGARNVAVVGIGHNAMLRDRAILRIVLDALQAGV